MPGYYWADLTTNEIEGLAGPDPVIVIPVAAIEQHGPHLPLSVDTDINDGILAAALPQIPDHSTVLVLPTLAIGKSNEHAAFAGTLTHSAEALIRSWTEVAESVIASGFRRLLFFNSHGGQSHIAEIVAVDLRVRHGVLAAWTSWTALGLPNGLIDEDERRFGIHGGAIETAMMLYLHADKVRRDKIADWPSFAESLEKSARHLSAGRRVGFAWQTQDLNPSGAVGNAMTANESTGRLLVDHAAEQLCSLIEDLRHFDLTVLNRARKE